jgi:hypothetical protein
MKKLLILVLGLCACKGQATRSFQPDFNAGPPTLVYKTKANYNGLVPVILSDDKAEIVSYPHPSDLKQASGPAVPTILKDGYLLDNRGISMNIAFTDLTYEEYAKLSEAPSLSELNAHIIDKDPLTELCNCGNRQAFTNVPEQLNELISAKELRTRCKVLR